MSALERGPRGYGQDWSPRGAPCRHAHRTEPRGASRGARDPPGRPGGRRILRARAGSRSLHQSCVPLYSHFHYLYLLACSREKGSPFSMKLLLVSGRAFSLVSVLAGSWLPYRGCARCLEDPMTAVRGVTSRRPQAASGPRGGGAREGLLAVSIRAAPHRRTAALRAIHSFTGVNKPVCLRRPFPGRSTATARTACTAATSAACRAHLRGRPLQPHLRPHRRGHLWPLQPHLRGRPF